MCSQSDELDAKSTLTNGRETVPYRIMPKFGIRHWLVVLALLALLTLFYGVGQEQQGSEAGENTGRLKRKTAVVVASRALEDTSWLAVHFPQWDRFIYHVDDSAAELTVPKNKGRESMVYLTYIIDHYETLSDNILFIHPDRYQWHNDDPDYDGLPMLRRFQISHVEQEGYVNMRCVWVLGCPTEILPFDQEGVHREDVHAGAAYKEAFQHLFPTQEVPSRVGVACCAQFAVTKETVRQRKKKEYIRYRDWLLATELDDSISGRVFEYSWHNQQSTAPTSRHATARPLDFAISHAQKEPVKDDIFCLHIARFPVVGRILDGSRSRVREQVL